MTRREPTEAELNDLIAKQSANLPAWWASATPKPRAADPDGKLKRDREQRRRWAERGMGK